jgi:EmrB/QacA subfamily drug resistance transporter
MNQKIAVGVVYVAALFMAIMDTTIVNVALPVLGRDFHTSPDAVDSVVIAFLVSTGVFLTASGWLGDRFGGRKVLLFSVVLFTGSSALCGVAGSLGELVVFRVLQGAAGGLMTPVGMAMLFRVFPPAERVRASSILMIPTALAPALGPVLGGLLVTDLSWRWVFYVNVPIGIAAVVFGALFLDDHTQAHPGPFDRAGFLLAASGLGLVMYGVSEGPLRGWGSTAVVGTIAAGAALLVTMVFVELRKAQPLLDLRVYGDRLFRSTSVVLTLGAVAFLCCSWWRSSTRTGSISRPCSPV